jgi:hypothetical protein
MSMSHDGRKRRCVTLPCLPVAAPLAALLLLTLCGCTTASQCIVQDGQPQAEIIIADHPPRMTKLAASELQTYIEKISGARLAITNVPGTNGAVRVYVGRSAHTDRLGITDEGLADGAFRMVSGKDFLVLLGGDRDFIPKKPWARHYGYMASMRAEWDKLTGSTWDNPVGGPLYRDYNGVMDLWAYDERGSLNAVYELLRNLGVRWYMPGDVGEILPRLSSIPLRKIDTVVTPAFALRCMTPLSTTYSSLNRDDVLWQLRLGLNAHCRAVGTIPHLSHGLNAVLGRPEMKAAHPEYYALIGGRRDTNDNHACLSSEGLFQEAVRFVRAMYAVYDARTVSLMPEDGFRFCECGRCKGQDTPERGRAGQYSDYVFGFVDRVAREVYKTHPDRTVNCFAYGTFTLTPEKIGHLSSNVLVGIVHARGWYFPNPTERGLELQLPDLHAAWRAKSSQPLMGWEHYPFTHIGTFLPVYFPHTMAAGLRALKGKSIGESVEVAWGPTEVRGHGLDAPAFNHLNVYLTARLYWDADQDLEALLEEYFRLYYGPAAADMRAFVAYAEANWSLMEQDGERIAKALALFEAARERVAPESAYARRLNLLGDYLVTLKQRGAQLARGRKDVLEARARFVSGPEAVITLDGRLEEPAWGPYLRQYRTHGLRPLETGAVARLKTSFETLWVGGGSGGSLCIGIQCEEPDPVGLRQVTAGGGEADVLNGDTVELLIETQAHSYYHLAINPAGRLADFDRRGGQSNPQWSSRAEVATHIGTNTWCVEVRVPVTGQDRLADPLHDLAGRRPSQNFPWFVNVIRRRVRDGRVEQWAWSPPGGTNVCDVTKFGKLYAW